MELKLIITPREGHGNVIKTVVVVVVATNWNQNALSRFHDTNFRH